MQERIVKMFDEIAPTYDLVNRIVSFGSDKIWRKKAIREALNYLPKNAKILDVACGSGDMIAEWKKYTNDITGLDPSKGMLEIAKKRFPEIPFYQGFAQNLPFEENFDCLSISFGLRNVVEIDRAIEEFYRVLKPNGILLILEFTKSKNNTPIKGAINFYSNKILPKIGGIISKNQEAYKYLPNSIEKFYTLNELVQKLNKFQILKSNTFHLSPASMIIAKKL